MIQGAIQIGMASLPDCAYELLEKLDEQAPLVFFRSMTTLRLLPHSAGACILQVPDELTQHVLRKNGQDCSDVRT